MSDSIKISGQKLELPEAPGGIQFERRPGGWIIAEINGVRRRLAYQESKGKMSVSLNGRHWFAEIQAKESSSTSSSGVSADHFTAQFPGKVRKVLAKEGALLSENDPILL